MSSAHVKLGQRNGLMMKKRGKEDVTRQFNGYWFVISLFIILPNIFFYVISATACLYLAGNVMISVFFLSFSSSFVFWLLLCM